MQGGGLPPWDVFPLVGVSNETENTPKMPPEDKTANFFAALPAEGWAGTPTLKSISPNDTDVGSLMLQSAILVSSWTRSSHEIPINWGI